jgi:hypothetical protein
MSSILPPRGRSRCHGGSSPARAAVAIHGVRESLSFTYSASGGRMCDRGSHQQANRTALCSGNICTVHAVLHSSLARMLE